MLFTNEEIDAMITLICEDQAKHLMKDDGYFQSQRHEALELLKTKLKSLKRGEQQ